MASCTWYSGSYPGALGAKERAGPCSKPWSTGRITNLPVPARRPWFIRRARLASVPGLSLPYPLRISRTRSVMVERSPLRWVGSSPAAAVAAAAARAGEEALVVLIDEGRDAALGALARHLVEHAVAVEAAPEQRRAADGDRGRDLAELLAEVVAGDEEVRRQLGIALETRVARQ